MSYDGLFELGLRLDKIIAKYDEDAYFEPEEPGITTAYIYNITPKKTNKRIFLISLYVFNSIFIS